MNVKKIIINFLISDVQNRKEMVRLKIEQK